MKDKSGPAFPISPYRVEFKEQILARQEAFEGLTKREWFAGMVIGGLLNRPGEAFGNLAKQHNMTPEAVLASAAVDCADALLAELNKEPLGVSE